MLLLWAILFLKMEKTPLRHLPQQATFLIVYKRKHQTVSSLFYQAIMIIAAVPWIGLTCLQTVIHGHVHTFANYEYLAPCLDIGVDAMCGADGKESRAQLCMLDLNNQQIEHIKKSTASDFSVRIKLPHPILVEETKRYGHR